VDKLLFGCSGLPLGQGRKFTQATAIPYLKDLGLEAMELLFVRSVNVTAKNQAGILAAKAEHGFYLSAHGSYYLNLNSSDPQVRDKSLQRIEQGAKGLALVAGRSLVFHPGFYQGDCPERAYAAIRDNLARLPDLGVDYRLETTGKGTQFGTLAELLALSREVKTCRPCIDFAHLHARGNGALKDYEDFARVLQAVQDALGRQAMEDLHLHMGGIAYGPKGERHHLPLLESDFNYKACLRALKDFGAKGCVICEGPRVQYDALVLKKAYQGL
jgi:deoxyribonuclease-4